MKQLAKREKASSEMISENWAKQRQFWEVRNVRK